MNPESQCNTRVVPCSKKAVASTRIADFDIDGLPDIFVANGRVYPQVDSLNVGQKYLQRKELYRNLGNGKFEELARIASADS